METAGAAFRATRFDGVLSNFGAINCVEDPAALARSIAGRIVRGGSLLWVAMGPYVPWEWAWYLSRCDIRRAFRRLHRQGTPWRGMTVRYPTPRGLQAALKPYFSIRHVQPLGCFLPPSYAAGWLGRFPRMRAVLLRLEQLGQSFPALAACADHYLIEARRACRDGDGSQT